MSKNGTRVVTCARCQNIKLHHARALCKCCYNKVMLRGLAALYPTGAGVAFSSGGSSEREESRARFGPSMGRPGLHTWRRGGMTQ